MLTQRTEAWTIETVLPQVTRGDRLVSPDAESKYREQPKEIYILQLDLGSARSRL
jgi:hypothetical protein